MTLPVWMFDTCVIFGDRHYDSAMYAAHNMDVKAPPNYPVTALLSGVVVDVSEPSWGWQVGIQLDVPHNGIPYMSYMHMAAPNPALRVGTRITKGDIVGWSGGGNSAAQYLGTTNPTGRNSINDPAMSSQTQQGVAFMRGPVYGGAGWDDYPPINWACDPTAVVEQARNEYRAVVSKAVLKLGRIGLFYGVETATWSTAQWDSAVAFCVAHKINFAVIKVFESTQGEWYGGNFSAIAAKFTGHGVAVLPYGFLYGSGVTQSGRSLDWEISMLEKYQQIYGCVCADMEGKWWWNNPTDGQAVATALSSRPGLFLASIPANPSANTFIPMNKVMLAMPMSYDDSLVAVTKADMAAVGAMPVYPTLDLSNEFGPNNVVANAQWARQYEQVTLWDSIFALQNPGLLDQVVSIIGSLPAQGGTMGVPTGWTDTIVNGDPQLSNPNNKFVVRGAMRGIVLNWPGGWESWNVPEENEVQQPVAVEQTNPALGPGVTQTFTNRRLEMIRNQGNKIISGWMGREMIWYMTQYAQVLAQLAVADASLVATASALTACQEALAACEAGQALSPQLQAVINEVVANVPAILAEVQKILDEVKPFAQ